jgi:probable biosynthetic protein (TIGR04098 family)
MAIWHTYGAVVTMPLLAPGEKLSETEFLKLLAAHQWESIARLFRQPTQRICNEAGQRLYASVLHFEMGFGDAHGPDRFCEGARLVVRNTVRTYAQRFVEGLFVFDDADVPDDALTSVTTRDALRAQPRPWAYMVNTFITRTAGNAYLTVSKPAGQADEADPLTEPPPGVADHGRVQRTGDIPPFDDDGGAGTPLPPGDARPIVYQIVPESDVNGAGLVYFARYVAMTSYAERVFAERLTPPLSNPLVETLSTERRRIYYYANAAPKDRVAVSVRCHVLPVVAPATAQPAPRPPIRTPFKLLFRMDLHRRSDHLLMASSLVRKALNVPAGAKAILIEAERFRDRLVRTGSI